MQKQSRQLFAVKVMSAPAQPTVAEARQLEEWQAKLAAKHSSNKIRHNSKSQHK